MANNHRVGLIMSGAPLPEALSAEMGPIPPCLLPLGSSFLLNKQCEELRHLCDEIYVSLPQDFELESGTLQKIKNDVSGIIHTKPDQTVTEAILECVEALPNKNVVLLILFGDTLIMNVASFPADAVSIHRHWSDYKWADLSRIIDDRDLSVKGFTISGLFSFSSIPRLIQSIASSSGDLTGAIRLYNEDNILEFMNEGQWYDFGHVQTYFRSSGAVTTQRAFNSIKVGSREVIKASDDHTKMAAEINWYESIPRHLTFYTPQFLGRREMDGKTAYATANTYLSPLNHLAVFGRLKAETWSEIFSACSEFLVRCKEVIPDAASDISIEDYFVEKTKHRLEILSSTPFGERLLSSRSVNNTQYPKIEEIVAETADVLSREKDEPQCLIHGDFCFSNIFYDYRSASIRVIDPRGLTPKGEISIYGPQSYDLSKIIHSTIYGYDLIISGHITADIKDDVINFDDTILRSRGWDKIVTSFRSSDIANVIPRAVSHAMAVHLFLSMLPLHKDAPERQLAMYATAMQAFQNMLES